MHNRYILFILSALIVAFGQPAALFWLGPVASAIGYALCFIALAGLAWRRRFALATLWFFAVQAVQLYWMTALEFPGASLTGGYLALALLLGAQSAALVPFISSSLSWLRVCVCACFWVMIEWSRLFFLCGFSWNGVGQALSSLDVTMQLASVIGALGLSFWVMLTNLVAFKAWLERSWKIAACWGVCAIFPYAFGMLSEALHDSMYPQPELSVALLQTNWRPYQKSPWIKKLDAYVPPLDQWKSILSQVSFLKSRDVDLLVCPEVMVALAADQYAYPLGQVRDLLNQLEGFDEKTDLPPLESPYAERSTDSYVSNLFLAQALANYLNTALILGLDHTVWGSREYFNSAFFLIPRSKTYRRYDKQILLPVGEYLPTGFGWMNSLRFNTFFTPGQSAKVWSLGNLQLAPCICYEETFSSIMHRARDKGANLFVNLTNDNYYPHSALHKQHLFHARLRAVENGVPLLRSCNAGGTAVIDSFGRIVQSLPMGKAGVLYIPSCKFKFFATPFSFYGDWPLVGGSCLGILLALVNSAARWRRFVASKAV